MLTALIGVLFCVVGYSNGTDVARCSRSNSSEATLSLTPYGVGVVGRYLAEWCTPVEPGATSWVLLVWYYDKDKNGCNDSPSPAGNKFSPFIYKQGAFKHSSYEQNITFDGNCSYVCLNTTLDLIFKSCYLLKSYFTVNEHLRRITQQFIAVDNNYSKELFSNNTARIEVHTYAVHKDGQDVSIVWHTGVPFTSYEDVKLWRKENVSRDISDARSLEPLTCSTRVSTEVRCTARLSPGHYLSQLTLHAPWEHGLFFEQGLIKYGFSVASVSVPEVAPARGAWRWAGGALAGVLALAGLLYVACRRRHATHMHKKVLREWLVHSNERSRVEAVKPARRHVVLLYAREGPLAARFTAALRALLECAPDTQVYDIFSPEVMAMAASSPGAWIRSMLQRSDVVVVVLQTPALAALYHHQLHDKGTTVSLSLPLLGRRVTYRAPHYGDTLLQYAVQVVGEGARTQHDYNKYYLATLSELPTEMFPALVPYRRYLLPEAGALLARDVCAGGAPPAPPAPLAPHVLALHAAAREYVDGATHNPDYLMDELVLIT